MDRWRERTALVTGSSYGIGYAILCELVKNGLTVIGCARNTKPLEELKSQLQSTNLRLDVIQCDLSKEEDILRMFKAIEEKYGHIDVLVNNAGTASAASFYDGKTEDWLKMITLNVLAMSICTRETLKLLEKEKVDDGHIININSTAGHDIELPDEDHAYSASKHMVTAMTRALDMELRKKRSKIRITSLSPGLVETPMTGYIKIDYQNKGTDYKFLEGKDVADAVVYILTTPPHVNIRELTIAPIEQPVP